MWYTGFRRSDNTIADGQVTDYSNLSEKHHIAAHFGTAGDSHLTAEQRIFANVAAVRHLHQVVNLNAAAKACLTHGSAINTTIGLNFHSVLYNHNAGLRNFIKGSIR